MNTLVLNKSTEKTKKQITVAAYILIALCVILAISVPTAHAVNDTFMAQMAAKYATSDACELFTKFLSTDNLMFQWCVGSYDASTSTATLPASISAMSTLYGTFKGIGFILAMAAALGRLFKQLEKGQEGPYLALQTLTQICITGIVIINIDKITGLIGEFGRLIILEFTPNEGHYSQEWGENLLQAYTGNKSGSDYWNIKATLSLMIPGVANVAAYYGVAIMIITKFIEIAVLRMFAPLAVYDIYEEGLRSSGAMYLKNLLSVFLSIAMSAFLAQFIELIPLFLDSHNIVGTGASTLTTVANIATSLFKEFSDGDNTFYAFIPTAANFALVKFMSKTDEIAKKVLGVR